MGNGGRKRKATGANGKNELKVVVQTETSNIREEPFSSEEIHDESKEKTPAINEAGHANGGDQSRSVKDTGVHFHKECFDEA